MHEPAPSSTASGVVLDIGRGTGALVMLVDADREGEEIDTEPAWGAGQHTHAAVLPRSLPFGTVHAVVIAGLPPGAHRILDPRGGSVVTEVRDGEVTQVDLRTKFT